MNFGMFTPQELRMYLVLGTLFGGTKAMFNQQQNMLVSPVFVSLIRSHIVQLFTGVTTKFCSRTHTCKFSGLPTAFSSWVMEMLCYAIERA